MDTQASHDAPKVAKQISRDIAIGVVIGISAAAITGLLVDLADAGAALTIVLAATVGALAFSLTAFDRAAPEDDSIVLGCPEIFQKTLFNRMETVKAARFAAAERLELRSKSINLVLSMLAAEAIIVGVVAIIFDLLSEDETVLTLCSLFAALFVLVLSLFQYGNHDDINSEKCRQNAMQIADLRRKLALISPPTFAVLPEIVDKYDTILKECPVNHDRVDFIKAKIVTGQYKDGARWKLLDNTWIVIRRVAPLAFISWIVFIVVGWVTVLVVIKSDFAII